MNKEIKKLLEVDDFNELNHLAIKFHYQNDPKLLSDDINYCLGKGYERATSDKGKNYWLKICCHLFNLFPYSVHLFGTKKFKDIMDERFDALNSRTDTTQRPAVPIDNDLPVEELINIFCPAAPEKKPAHKKKNAKEIPSGNTVEVKGGLIVFGTFIPHYIVSEILNYNEKKKKTKLKPIKPNKDSLNITTIEDLVENYLKSVGSRQKFSESTKKEYRFVSKLLQEFLDSKSIGINDINLIVAEEFQDSLLNSKDGIQKRGEKRVNNIVGFLSKIFERAVNLGFIETNYFSKTSLIRFSINEKTTKRNFTVDELESLFSGQHGIEKEILDYFRFKLHVGLRMEEFFRLNENSFITETIDGQAYNCVIIDTAKGKYSSESKRVIVLHENIKDLHNYKWVKTIKEKYPTIKSFDKKANGCIKKVISDKKVSDHRLRGNFAKKLVEYDQINNISDSIVNVADELGHNTNKNNRKNLEQYNDLVRGMLGYNLSDALDIYAQSKLLKPKLRYIKAFDEYSGIFKYLDIPSNKIPHIKSNKNNKKDKK
ncbi:phage integrase SAM-like domain-containing protein [Campylobacter concisus]|uniref:phage integrase SAM-like domain-containing protein n=2 Tax=Campylobacter concisus TaxID=199 RepID=UPI00122CC696|nr:phage integrase SAM-like domain-containing protein [Campylobacter concisus]MCA6130866.1 phage integrase SAM-like domain-containing protein [Campylobacter concisus]MCA6132787.1 phage integrase SAM-like domain-containing protein [Campylobacter concisus]